MAQLGILHEYVEAENWSDYVERLEQYFVANDIDNGEKKRAVLLTVCGKKTYSLMKDLLAPAKVTDKSYEDLINLITGHTEPKPNIIVSRFKFYSNHRQNKESVADYVARLRRLAEPCDFGATLEEMLRDRLVLGINDNSIQRRMLAEPDLTFKKAVDISGAILAVDKQVHDINMEAGYPSIDTSVKQIQGNPRARFKRQVKPNYGEKAKCWKCGREGHLSRDENCPAKRSKCHRCGITGHFEIVCRSKNKPPDGKKKGHTNRKVKGQLGELDVNDDYEDCCEYDYNTVALPTSRDCNDIYHELFTITNNVILSRTSTDPYQTVLNVNGINIKMEIDTGAAVSVISDHMLKQVWPNSKDRPIIKPSDAKLKTYTGEEIKVVGVCHVKVKCMEGKLVMLPLVVIPGRGSTLIGRNWLTNLQLDWGKIKQVQTKGSMLSSEIIGKYDKVFENNLGEIKGFKARLLVKEGAVPKFCKARPIPFGIKDKVEKELHRLKQEGTITPINFSEWAAPIVPVIKSDGSVRICGDYKLTINQVAKVDTYPLPLIDDLFAKLGGGKIFSKLDMSHAYQQLILSEESKQYTVINTHLGLYKYNRLPFGVSSAPGIFQRVVDSITLGLPGVVAYLDDILVSGTNQREHDMNLEGLLLKLKEVNIKLKREKCVFNSNEVEYLGFKIDAKGLHPLNTKVKAIRDAPNPTNVTELKAYLGLLNYYGRFMKDLSSLLAPLYELLNHNTEWLWSDRQENAFRISKELLTSSNVLVHYDRNKPLMLTCDASPYGVGVVLSHIIDSVEQPVAFASRRLSETESRYSQLDKEALAIIYGVKKFHKYVYGCKFMIVTDHKPLLGIFGEGKGIPQMASPRMQRWALMLSGYDYNLKFKPGEDNQNADALSRVPVGEIPKDPPIPGDIIMLLEKINNSPIKSKDVVIWTRRDPTLSKVYKYVQMGWKDNVGNDSDLLPYYRRKNELSTENGIVLWGARIVMPSAGRETMLKQLHEGHPGIARMKAVARTYVWWPNMDSQIEETVKACTQCQCHKNLPAAAPLNPWPWPEKAWSRIHIDYAGPFMNKMILVVVDAHSKWIEAVAMDTSTSQATIAKLRNMFATFGIPELLVSDNGSNFTSEEFAEFLKRNGIKHVRTAPYHPASNGQAERAVETVKEGLRKMETGNMETKLARFLFNYRNTPHTTTGETPAKLMFGRPIKTHLHLLMPNIGAQVRKGQAEQKQRHDSKAKERVFSVSENIFVRDIVKGIWLPGVITEQSGPVSYHLKLNDGRVFKRHVDHIRKRTTDEPKENERDDVLSYPFSLSNTNHETANNAPPIVRRSHRARHPPDRYQ